MVAIATQGVRDRRVPELAARRIRGRCGGQHGLGLLDLPQREPPLGRHGLMVHVAILPGDACES